MRSMDHTPLDDLVSDLESADPADAPDLADAIAARLSAELEEEEEGKVDPAPPA